MADEALISGLLTPGQYVFKNLKSCYDIYFSQGRWDVLDHSCSKIGLEERCVLTETKKF